MTTTHQKLVRTPLWGGNLVDIDIEYSHEKEPSTFDYPGVDEITVNNITLPCGFKFEPIGSFYTEIESLIINEL